MSFQWLVENNVLSRCVLIERIAPEILACQHIFRLASRWELPVVTPPRKISGCFAVCVTRRTESWKLNDIPAQSKVEVGAGPDSIVCVPGGSSLPLLKHAPDQRAYHIKSLHAPSCPGHRDRRCRPARLQRYCHQRDSQAPAS